MGVSSVYFLGLPIIENAADANKRREDREDRITIRKNASVAKKVVKETGNVLQEGVGDGMTEAEGIAASVAGGAAGIFGGGSSSLSLSSTPVLIGLGLVLLVVVLK